MHGSSDMYDIITLSGSGIGPWIRTKLYRREGLARSDVSKFVVKRSL